MTILPVDPDDWVRLREFMPLGIVPLLASLPIVLRDNLHYFAIFPRGWVEWRRYCARMLTVIGVLYTVFGALCGAPLAFLPGLVALLLLPTVNRGDIPVGRPIAVVFAIAILIIYMILQIENRRRF